jgi:hypothetical protein
MQGCSKYRKACVSKTMLYHAATKLLRTLYMLRAKRNRDEFKTSGFDWLEADESGERKKWRGNAAR